MASVSVGVTIADGNSISYFYNASGNKLQMKTYQGSTLQHTTDYIGGFVYVDGTLSFFGTPEGRVVKKGNAFDYEYSIADHQGNTRVVFTSATPEPQVSATDFESDPGDIHNFPDGGNLSSFALFNNTSGGTKSQLLNGGYNGQVGVGKSFAVYPGDKVKIEAFAKFEGTNSSNASPFASALLSAFGLSAPGTAETGTARAGLNTWGTLVDAGYHQPDPARPQAHVTILILDRDYNFLDFATQQISASAEQVGASPDVDHEYLTREYTIKEPGFVYMYVSNNSPVNVYFDDVTFTHTPTRVIQYNEYYPFGLQTSSSWTRENNSNDFLYNAGAELNSSAGWYETFFRGYDPALGRFNQVDPMASAASSFTPYNYAFNSPVLLNDPMGDYPKHYSDGLPNYNPYSMLFKSGVGTHITAGSGNHWSDQFGSDYRDFFLMNGDDFGSKYGRSAMEFYQKLQAEANNWGAPQGPDGYTGYASVRNQYGTWRMVNRTWVETTSADQMKNRGEWEAKQGDDWESTNPYDGHSISVGGNIAFGGGINFGLGVVFNNDGDWRFFGYGGPSFGIDASVGVAIKGITNANSAEPFDPNQYKGWGSSHNIALGPLDIVLIGGDNYPNFSTGTMGASYNEGGGGVSLGLPLGYTYQTAYTSFPGDW